MDARDTTTATNADLWACYFRSQLHAWLDPLGLAAPDDLITVVADGAAANIAAAVSAMIGDPITRMCAENTREVTAAAEAANPHAAPAAEDAIPPQYARDPGDATQLEAWRSDASAASPVDIGDNAILAY